MRHVNKTAVYIHFYLIVYIHFWTTFYCGYIFPKAAVKKFQFLTNYINILYLYRKCFYVYWVLVLLVSIVTCTIVIVVTKFAWDYWPFLMTNMVKSWLGTVKLAPILAHTTHFKCALKKRCIFTYIRTIDLGKISNRFSNEICIPIFTKSFFNKKSSKSPVFRKDRFPQGCNWGSKKIPLGQDFSLHYIICLR